MQTPKGDVNASRQQAAQATAARLRTGEPRVVDTFVRENMPWMLRTAERLLKDRSAAEDAVQVAFMQIFRNLESFRGESELQGWMHRIVINQALSAIRKTKRLNESPIDNLLPEFDAGGCRVEPLWNMETPESLLASTQTRAEVRKAIEFLPDQFRVILILRDIEELSTADVAAMLHLTEGNVKVRLHRARSALKKLLEPIFSSEDLP